MSWRDPRLELPADARAATKEWRRMDAARVWTPRVYFENALEQPRLHADSVIEVAPDGMVTSWSIVSSKFSTPLHLERFPFDRQRLTVRIGAFEDESVMKFRVKNELVLLGEDAFLTVGFAFVVLSVVAVTVIHISVTHNRLEQALSIRRIVRRIYLPAYLLAVLLNLGVLID